MEDKTQFLVLLLQLTDSIMKKQCDLEVIAKINELKLEEDQLNQLKDYFRNPKDDVDNLFIAINNLTAINNKKYFLDYIKINNDKELTKDEVKAILDTTYEFDSLYDKYKLYSIVVRRVILFNDPELTKLAIDKLQA